MNHPDQILEVIIGALPQSDRITNINTSDCAVRFTWGFSRWRVSLNLFVEKVEEGILRTDTSTRLMEALLQTADLLRNAE